MKSTTILLTDEQAERLRDEVRRTGISSENIIRRALDDYLGVAVHAVSAKQTGPSASEGESTESPPLWFIGLGASSGGAIGRKMEELMADEWTDALRKDQGKPCSETNTSAKSDSTKSDQSHQTS